MSNRNLALTLFRNSIPYSIGTILIINNFSLNIHLINKCLFLGSFSLNNGISFLFRQGIKCLLLFDIKNFIFGYCDIHSLYFYSKLISARCSVCSFSVSSLDYEHGLSIDNVLLEETRSKTYCLVCFCIQEIGEF